MTWNRVVTIDDFYDRPRAGVAFHGGDLVAYESLWNEELDDYSAFYGLTSIDRNLLPLVEERQAIWERWANAFHAGQTTLEIGAPLPEDRTRYAQISATLRSETAVDEENCLRLKAEFRPAPRDGMPTRPGLGEMEVRWFSDDVD